MGITFLAAGASIPDAYSSVIVVRQGDSLINLKKKIRKETSNSIKLKVMLIWVYLTYLEAMCLTFLLV